MTVSDRLERVEDALDRLSFILRRAEEKQELLHSMGRHEEARALNGKVDRMAAKAEAMQRELQVLRDIQEERREAEEELLRREYRRMTRYRAAPDK